MQTFHPNTISCIEGTIEEKSLNTIRAVPCPLPSCPDCVQIEVWCCILKKWRGTRGLYRGPISDDELLMMIEEAFGPVPADRDNLTEVLTLTSFHVDWIFSLALPHQASSIPSSNIMATQRRDGSWCLECRGPSGIWHRLPRAEDSNFFDCASWPDLPTLQNAVRDHVGFDVKGEK